ncbi:MAG TPA: homocysteine S-methyltransferase family protein [Candidatus Eisenbacteria bacterium]
MNRLIRGEIVLLDGAMGTELERRGVGTPLPLWSAQALIDDAPAVRRVHEEYARAGADVLTAATFRTTPRALAKAGRAPGEADRLTEAAVTLAAEGRALGAPGRTVWIAGSIAPLEDCYRPEASPVEAVAEREHAEQAARLRRAGADFILVETMNTIAEARAAARGAAATGLPVVVSFICRNDRELLDGAPLADAAREVAALSPIAILVNCTPPDVAAGCLETLSRAVTTPIGCYPNAGAPNLASGAWTFDPHDDPDRFAALSREWVRRGAQIVGGCCGTGPAHTRALREALPPVLVE